MSDIETILLEPIAKIKRHYAELAKLSGENFNVFDILGLRGKELYHSAFIAELLNPQGSHGLGGRFLQYFLARLNTEHYNKKEALKNFDCAKASVRTEFVLDDDDGRVDITITNSDQKIHIENKIYAGDQPRQIARYCRDGALVIYLTLTGRPASPESAEKLEPGKDYLLYSYNEMIIDWLEQCKKDAADFPLLRETINQYILLIKNLTGQERSSKMTKEVLEVMSRNEETITASFTIRNNCEKLVKEIIKKHFVPKLNALAKKRGLICDIADADYCLETWWAFCFMKPKWKHIRLHFEFFTSNLSNLHHCLLYYEDPKINKHKDLQKRVRMAWGDWNNDAAILDLIKPESVILKEIEDKIQKSLDFLDTQKDLKPEQF